MSSSQARRMRKSQNQEGQILIGSDPGLVRMRFVEPGRSFDVAFAPENARAIAAELEHQAAEAEKGVKVTEGEEPLH